MAAAVAHPGLVGRTPCQSDSRKIALPIRRPLATDPAWVGIPVVA